MAIFTAFWLTAPFFAGIAYYVTKFAWLHILRKSPNPFHDPAGIRWWFSIATGVGLMGLMWTTSPLFDVYETGADISLLLFFTAIAWVWLVLHHRTMFEIFDWA